MRKTLALIGTGRWGKNIISTLEKIPSADLKYLCGNDTGQLSAYSDKYEKISDWRDLLDKKDLDGVLIATPAQTHFEISEAFLKKGLAVFTEKPMVLNTEDAKKLKSLVEKTGSIFMVGYQYVYNDYIRFLKQEVDSGSLGKITEIKSDQALIPPSHDINVFWDAGSHPLSIFRYLFNLSRLVSVTGKIEPDSASIKVEFENAPKLLIATSCLGPTKTRKFIITGEKATVILDETLEKDKLSITKNGKTTRPEITTSESLKNELEHFLKCVNSSIIPLTDVNFGYQITSWLETISSILAK